MNKDTAVSESTPDPENAAMTGGFYRRFAVWILLAFAASSPWYFWIAGKVLTPGDMSAYLLDVSHWLPNDTLLIRDMEKFSEVVGKERGNVIRISWEGCNADDPRLKSFASQLRSQKWTTELQPSVDSRLVFDEVLTIDQIVEQMASSNPNLSISQIHDQLANVMIGPDGTTCAIATLSTREPPHRKYAFEKISESANAVAGLDSADLKFFGGPVYTRKIDESGLRIATNFTPFSVLISIICTWICVRNPSVMMALFLNAVVGCCAALVSLHVLSAKMDPLLMLLPGFWFIMCISAGLHFINYFHEAREANQGCNDIATETVKIAFWPSFLATLTTCIGLSSLCTSDILPLWRFGFHASIGLACSFISLYLFLPSFLTIFSKGISRDPKVSTSGDKFWSWYESFAIRFRYKVAIVFLLLLGVAAVGFSRLGFSNKLNDQFAAGTKINLDTEWFEGEIGPVIPFELLIRFPKDNLPRPSSCLGFVDSLQQKLANISLPTKILSATAVVPYDAGSGARQAVRRTILDKKLARQRGVLEGTGFVIDEPDAELWRITIFAYSSTSWSMNDYFTQILRVIEQHKSADDEKLSARFSYAGLGSRMAVITRRLGGGLIRSCFTSALLISLVVIIALRSIFLGLTAMIPNIFPIVFSFGMYGFCRPSLDIGSIMTASIAMGIAVDDTIHFMYWFRRGLRRKLSRTHAIRLAIRKCGRAIASTSLICGLGFLVFFFCDFMPVARFGQLLFVMLTAALVGDLFFLPALLRSIPESLLGVKIRESSVEDSVSTTS